MKIYFSKVTVNRKRWKYIDFVVGNKVKRTFTFDPEEKKWGKRTPKDVDFERSWLQAVQDMTEGEDVTKYSQQRITIEQVKEIMFADML